MSPGVAFPYRTAKPRPTPDSPGVCSGRWVTITAPTSAGGPCPKGTTGPSMKGGRW
jgi:hypothetical protein